MQREITIPMDILKLSQAEIKTYLEKHMPNGEYTHLVCLGCGRYYTGPYSSTDKCEFVATCRLCYDMYQ